MNRLQSLGMMLSVSIGMSAQEVGGYGFLDIPVSAHSSALGGTVVSIVEPESSLAENNASLLCPEMSGRLAASYMNWLSDIHLANVSYTGGFLESGAWQSGIRYVDYGTFDGYDEWGNATGSFGAKDMAIHVAVGYPLAHRWRIGGALRTIYSKYESESAFAVGADIGVNYYNEVAGRSLSLSLTNVGGQLKTMGNRRISMPTRLTAGITKEVEHLPFVLSLTGTDLLNWDGTEWIDHLLFSAEWIANDSFYLAAGYNYRRQHEFQGSGGFLRGLSAGCGFNWQEWHFALSYASYNAVDGSLHFELSYHF